MTFIFQCIFACRVHGVSGPPATFTGFLKRLTWVTVIPPTDLDTNYHRFFKHLPPPSGCTVLAGEACWALVPCPSFSGQLWGSRLLSLTPLLLSCFQRPNLSEFNCPQRKGNGNLSRAWTESTAKVLSGEPQGGEELPDLPWRAVRGVSETTQLRPSAWCGARVYERYSLPLAPGQLYPSCAARNF